MTGCARSRAIGDPCRQQLEGGAARPEAPRDVSGFAAQRSHPRARGRGELDELGVVAIVGVLERDADRHAVAREPRADVRSGASGDRPELGGGGEQGAGLGGMQALDGGDLAQVVGRAAEIERLTGEQLARAARGRRARRTRRSAGRRRRGSRSPRRTRRARSGGRGARRRRPSRADRRGRACRRGTSRLRPPRGAPPRAPRRTHRPPRSRARAAVACRGRAPRIASPRRAGRDRRDRAAAARAGARARRRPAPAPRRGTRAGQAARCPATAWCPRPIIRSPPRRGRRSRKLRTARSRARPMR
jgi:hypothetical protein